MKPRKSRPERVHLTDATARKLPGPAAGRSEIVHWDATLEGFGLRVYATGRRIWIVGYRVERRQRWVTLGTTAELKAAEARKKAGEIRAKAKLGHDERAEIEKRKAEVRKPAPETFGSVVARYLHFAERKQKPSSYRETARYLLRRARPLHDRPFTEVDRRMVASLRSKIVQASGPVAANRFCGAMCTFYNWALGEGIVENNPVLGLRREREIARERVLSGDELRAIWACTDGASHFGKIVRLLMLTGCRRGEVASMAWSELDLDGAEWLIPGERAKNGRQHLVPLSTLALEVLADVPRVQGRDLLFGEGAGAFSGWSRAKGRLDKRLEDMLGTMPGWTLHDLRRTTATGMAELGIAPHIVEAVLNHVSGHKAGVAGVYNRAQYAGEKRAALEQWGEHLRQLVGEGEATVVPLRAAVDAAS